MTSRPQFLSPIPGGNTNQPQPIPPTGNTGNIDSDTSLGTQESIVRQLPTLDPDLHHMLSNVARQDVSSVPYRALLDADVFSIYDFMTLEKEDIIDFTVLSITNERKVLSIGHRNLLILLHSFMHYSMGDSEITPIWDTLTADGFNHFRLTKPLKLMNRPYGKSTDSHDSSSTSSHGGLNTTFNTQRELMSFKKSIKRDITVYPILKDERKFDTFETEFLAMARTHDIEEVFDPTYTPSNLDDTYLFKEKQNFAYAILLRSIQTDKGRTAVRDQRKTYDAQKAWAQIIKDQRDGTAADITVSSLQEILHTTKITETWRGTATGFLLYWKNTMSQLEEILPSHSHYTPGLKKTMLKAAVSLLEPLANVDAIDANVTAGGGTKLNFDQYFNLLLSAAARYDKKSNNTARNRRMRTVNYLDLEPYEFLELGESTEVSDEIMPGSYLTNVTSTKETTLHRLPDDIFALLPPDAKKYYLWGRRNYPDNQRTQVQTKVHDLSENINDNHGEMPNVDTDTLPESKIDNQEINHEESSTNPILAHLTKQSEIPPTDLRRILGVPKKKEETGKRNSRQPSDNHRSVRMNDITYYTKQHNVTYKVSLHDSEEKHQSLMDRGCNGGVAGNDVRLVDQNIDRYADITGIENHTIKKVPIGTVAGLVQSNQGPIILYMHQYAYTGKGHPTSGQRQSRRDCRPETPRCRQCEASDRSPST